MIIEADEHALSARRDACFQLRQALMKAGNHAILSVGLTRPLSGVRAFGYDG
jgi:hypothetical protein